MKTHQILTGACNAGDKCFAVGSVEGVPFTAYASGCNVVILANSFERVQVIPGICHDNVQISCIDCSTDTGKTAAAYGKIVCIFEPTPLQTQTSTHHLDYRWIKTGVVEASCYINTLSWNLEGTRIITAGDTLQLWAPPTSNIDTRRVSFDVDFDAPNEPDWNWTCTWQCDTATPTVMIEFSPDGTLFATCSSNDRLVRIWYDNKLILSPSKFQEGNSNEMSRVAVSYGFIYLPHPSAVTGFTWRATSKYMPKGSVSNMLVTSCRDNICRVWAETVLPDDGLVSLTHVDPGAAQNPRFRMHRHKCRFMQRLKHIKACFHMRRHSKSVPEGVKTAEPIPSLPSSYSIHDFHMYGAHAAGVTPGFHFHLAATINAETDIPLVPSISPFSEQNFVLHWMNNKEMHFTSEAESILLEVSKRAVDRDNVSLDADQTSGATDAAVGHGSRHQGSARSTPMRGKSLDEDDVPNQPVISHRPPVLHPMSAATSTTSIATDVTAMTSSALGDALDRRIEGLLRDWFSNADVLFSIHPVDGSLLMWVLDYLDGTPGTFRQAQVSFSARIPSALPLGDAMTMSPSLTIYNGSSPYFLKTLIKLEAAAQDEERNKGKSKSNLTVSSNEDKEHSSLETSPFPIICLSTKHSNGSLNLWHLTVAANSRFTQILNISHSTRVCGHRFQLNDIKCHPVLPLLLTTSHHNKQYTSPGNPPSIAASEDTPLICIQDSPSKDWCSEVILWRVDAVGPLNISGGVTELSRINSPQVSAFSNAAWIPTLLPSTCLGKVSNSPSACFVASDGESLRVYQAVIDGRALLAEISTAERKKRSMEQTLSLSTDSSLQENVGQKHLSDIFNVVSEQSTARPGCVLQLDSIVDAQHDWQNTQFLHVFQECLIRGEKMTDDEGIRPDHHSAMVDLHSQSVFEEPFYVTLLEKTVNGPTMHMWRLVISSDTSEANIEEGHEGEVPLSSEAAPVNISTSKIYFKPLPLPSGVEVVHACPAAGHLSSASIYPACFAPYLMVTACSDNVVRFWRCKMVGEGKDFDVEWQEWGMISKERKSAITVPGEIFYVRAAYSGRIAVAHRADSNEKGVASVNNALVFSSMVSIYECESTGGSEWVLSDTIDLQDVIVNQGRYLGQDLDLSFLSNFADDRQGGKLAHIIASDDVISSLPNAAEAHSEHYSAEAIHAAATQMHIPSISTIKSLRNNQHEHLTVDLKQKHPVQLSWLSLENGSHLLTVAIGSKIFVYACVSEEVWRGQKGATGNTEIITKSALQKSPSINQISLEAMPKWMRLDKFSLSTADGLPPLPMRIAWIRDGVLVIGMDNEIQVCTQWSKSDGDATEAATGNNRDLTQVQLKSFMQDSNTNRPKTAASMARITSYSVLSSLDDKMKKGLGDVIDGPVVEDIDDLTSYGIFEMSRMVAPVRPQYDPSQLIELLNSGKIRRVKAILAHLLRCLMVLSQSSTEVANRGSISDGEQEGWKFWSRARAFSVSASATPSGVRDGRNSVSLRPEELTLDYIKVSAIPPLPLWLLLEADNDTHCNQRIVSENKQDAYAELFGSMTMSSDADDLDLDEDVDNVTTRRRSLTQEKRSIAFFGPRQAQCLAGLLTHTHLPGLSSLDQMHLLALADTVASCNVDFADKFDINKAKEALAKETYGRSAMDEPSMDSLDDCGLRFLLAMRHHTYLLRCLPIGQRPQLIKAGIGTHNVVWAFHSESQEELLEFIPAVRQGNIRWAELRELGIGYWVRSNALLSKIMLKVAKAAFTVRKDPLDAAIYYLAMQKKSLVWGLFRSVNDGRMTDFFSNNFTEERWRLAALKNAFALMGKQRFEHAAAFFLLAGALNDALEVVLNKLNDEQLAFIIARLYEGELNALPPTLQRLLHARYLGSDEEGKNQELTKIHPDPFLRSMAYWLLRSYNNSLKTLLMSDPEAATGHPEYSKKNKRRSADIDSADPSVFNFYIYLRTHPLLIRHCIANSAKDNSGALMASRFGAGYDTMDKKALYESSMTPQERCLYFKTASAHLCSGCPALALEVLSKLPNNVIDLDNPDSGDLLGSPVKEKRPGLDLIKSGTFEETTQFKLSTQKAVTEEPDWSVGTAPAKKSDDLELDLDFNIEASSDEEEIAEEKDDSHEADGGCDAPSTRKRMDIMAQQLKFICCLQLLMEELATLATGCEVDGGQLRYQLYVWLEREVDALKEICNYRIDESASGAHLILLCDQEEENLNSTSPVPVEQPSTLHEILHLENKDFEYKSKRAIIRKRWLWANRKLLRTLLSYCALHGSSGGGLASVRMELILLLQELQQESTKQQLHTPLPLPTTLPLLSASIANNKTVVVDPVRHLQCATHDLLQSLIEVRSVTSPDLDLVKLSLTLRNLAAALSACIYQSLCDSENIYVKSQPRVAALGLDLQQVSVAHRESLLIGKMSKLVTHEGEKVQVFTPPNKWPGVASLLALINHERDEDLPRLNILLSESFVSIYLCLLIHSIASSDAYGLYRLVSVDFKEKDWGILFGGGVKRNIRVITGSGTSQSASDKTETTAIVTGEKILSTISNLQKSRIKLNMKFLGQLGFQDPRSMPAEGDTKMGTREQFCPPELSIVSYLMSKPNLPTDADAIDYDSCESDEDEDEIDYEDDDDIFKEPKIFPENTEHRNTDSYSWCLLRLACMKSAQNVVFKFLIAAGIDLQDLIILSPLLSNALHTMEVWTNLLVGNLEDKKGPPPEFIPGCFAQTNVSGPAILKYKALLESHNTPFARSKRGVKPVNRLWQYLIRQENIQPLFIRYIFGRKRPTMPIASAAVPSPDMGADENGSESAEGAENDEVSETGFDAQQEMSEGGGGAGSDVTPPPSLEPVRIIHKDQDSITAFCINKINNNLVALATVKEIQEVDISLLLKHPSWLTNECEMDVMVLNKDPDSIASSNYLLVQTPYDKAFIESKGGFEHHHSSTQSGHGHSGRSSNVLKDLKGGGGGLYPGCTNPRFSQLVSERSKHYLKPVLSYKLDNPKRMTAHPNLALYLVGCQDGSVVVREWKHSQVVSQPRPGGTFAKVTRVRFNQQGNKFGVIDGDGHLSLYHLGVGVQDNKPYYTHHCHNKHGNDFTFVGSSSLLATAGQSSEHRNVALWDTLMPPRKANIVSWMCHESGASSVIYAPQHQVLVSAGKKGQVCIFDVRQRTFRHKFQAHDSAIKCMALDLNEDFFVTGSADGDIKIWGLSVHNLIYNLPGEHSRTSLFKNLSQGVTNLYMDSGNRLFSCGADGSVKMRYLPEKDFNINLL